MFKIIINSTYIKFFNELKKIDILSAGGKGASLGEMTSAGIPVPPGFLILIDAFERFLDETKVREKIEPILGALNQDTIDEIEKASEKIRNLILRENVPADIKEQILNGFKELDSPFVAVRSSATAEDSAGAAWAGQLESYLNTTEKDLIDNVKRCWASLFTPRAIYYRIEKGLKYEKISVAVVIQKMVQSEVSGIAFSVHPVTEDHNQLIIEASYGLGEAIVSGQVTPDRYVVDKKKREIVEIMVQEKNKGLFREASGGNSWKDIPQDKIEQQALTDKQIIELSDLIIKIEKHYGFPVDVEWALEKGKFYITQSRPITTLSIRAIDNSFKQLKKFLTRDAPLIAMEHWWYKGCAEAFPEFFGFSFPRIFILKDNGAFTSYWDTGMLDEYTRGYLNWLKNNSSHINLIHERLAVGLEFFRKVRSLDERTPIIELVKTLEITTRYFQEGLPAVDAVHVLPGIHKHLQAERKSPFNDTQIRKLISWREDAGNFFFNDGIDAFYFLLELIGKKTGWQKNLLKYITFTELTGALTNNKSFPIEELHKRRDLKFAFIDGKIVFEPDIEEALRLDGYFLKQDDVPSVNEIKGLTAMPGKTRGICRVIFERSQLNYVGEGEILVAPMTSPWYIPAMKLAAGIITDEGGITSHAAILSRELKKPCIIGTKIATQVLKDGDLVEVDADKGVVKILKKSGDKDGEQDKIKWITAVKRHHTPLFIDFLINGQTQKRIKGNTGYNFFFSNILKDGLILAYDESEIKNNRDWIKKYWKKNGSKIFWDFAKSCQDSCNKSLSDSRSLGMKDYSNDTASQLIEAFSIYSETVINHASFLQTMILTQFELEEYALQLISSKFKELNKPEITTQKLLDDLSIPSQPTHEVLNALDVLEIAEQIQKNQKLMSIIIDNDINTLIPLLAKDYPSIWKKILNYKEKFGWMGRMYYDGSLINESDIILRLKNLLQKNCKNILSEIKLYAETKIKKRCEAIKILGGGKEIKDLGELISIYLHLRSYRLDVFFMMNENVIGLLEAIAKGLDLTYFDLIYLTSAEILDGLKNELSKQKLGEVSKNRKIGYSVFVSNNIPFWTEKSIKENKPDKRLGNKYSSIKLLNGVCACAGNVRGLVRKIMTAEEITNMNSGDVLVTTMTMPSLMLAIEKASAIVTDEGGMLCHAAIISRELKIPCIIGTKIATQVLKEGDLVEVDADRGVVKIIK